jgi:hypothetical protein
MKILKIDFLKVVLKKHFIINKIQIKKRSSKEN